MDLYRVPRGSVRHSDPVWRLPGNDCWICARFARRGTLYRNDCRQDRSWKAERRASSLDALAMVLYQVLDNEPRLFEREHAASRVRGGLLRKPHCPDTEQGV